MSKTGSGIEMKLCRSCFTRYIRTTKGNVKIFLHVVPKNECEECEKVRRGNQTKGKDQGELVVISEKHSH